jgi:phosphatidylserine/phosphatidylglycerophosphate/cardiolipin synthase-like enzyme
MLVSRIAPISAFFRTNRKAPIGNFTDPTLTTNRLAGGVEVRVKASQDLMHFKSYVIDGALLRTGSANWSPTGLKRQDNDVHYEVDAQGVVLK